MLYLKRTIYEKIHSQITNSRHGGGVFCFSTLASAAISDSDWQAKSTEEKIAYAKNNYNELSDTQKTWVRNLILDFMNIYNGGQLPIRKLGSGNFDLGNGSPALIAGEDNKASFLSIAVGKQAKAYGRESIAMGYQPGVFGDSGIAIGNNTYSLPTVHPLTKQLLDGPNGNATPGLSFGNLATSSGSSMAIGGAATSLGYGSVVVGINSAVVSKDTEKYIPGPSQFSQNSDVWVDYLVSKGLPKGAYNGTGLTPEQKIIYDEIDKKIKDYYRSYLSYIHYGDPKMSGITWSDDVMNVLRYQYILEVENTQPYYGTSIGISSITNTNGGVALGAFSRADRKGFSTDTEAPFSKINLKGVTTGAVSIGSESALRQLINLADGTEDTDAVNLRQLKAAVNNTSGTSGSLDTIQGDSNIIVETTTNSDGKSKTVNLSLNKKIYVDSVTANKSITVGSTNIDSQGISIQNGPSVTTSGVNAGNKRITKLARGVDPTDAVNMAQLGEVKQGVAEVGRRVNQVSKEVRGIGANVAAGIALPQSTIAGKSMIAASVGGYKGSSAVAVGWSKLSNNSKVVVKFAGTANSEGDISGGVGFGYHY
ncbi:YadA-like family protein [Gallibacterium salpingitidis]|uniref:YadA-like family protein n=2 Tax=Gallibacterium salpingitidis TaxID=505341 RepID=UPI000B110702|nr:YadA-like family protein [Gallibacterium salpingitidis]WKS99451.1 YadA-like family protein [Gallibacterium salpingitidis]